MGRQVFRVDVLDGRGFGSDPQALLCSASLAGDTKSTPYAVNHADSHVWNSILAWGMDADAARKATSCKLSIVRRDGIRLGWVVLDLRAAKLPHQSKTDPDGTCRGGRCMAGWAGLGWAGLGRSARSGGGDRVCRVQNRAAQRPCSSAGRRGRPSLLPPCPRTSSQRLMHRDTA